MNISMVSRDQYSSMVMNQKNRAEVNAVSKEEDVASKQEPVSNSATGEVSQPQTQPVEYKIPTNQTGFSTETWMSAQTMGTEVSNYATRFDANNYAEFTTSQSGDFTRSGDYGTSTTALVEDPDNEGVFVYTPDDWLTEYRGDETLETDPTDYSNASTYDPSAWLSAYKASGVADSYGLNTESDSTTDTESEETVVDPTDFTNKETYDPSAWLASYRGETVTTPEATVTPDVTVTPEVESPEVTTPQEEIDPADEVKATIENALEASKAAVDSVANYFKSEESFSISHFLDLFGK